MRFFVGTHQLHHLSALDRAMVSANRLLTRRKPIEPNQWILDSGAFTRITSGLGHLPLREYVNLARHWSGFGHLQAVVAQDFMCEPFVLELTGKSIAQNQRMTSANYLRLRDALPELYVMPVLQGWTTDDYRYHLAELSPSLEPGAWVGVGTLCKRQGSPSIVSGIITGILRERPDLKLHGFGVKTTALQCLDITSRLYSADSAAWSYAGRRETPSKTHDLDFCLKWAEKVTKSVPRETQTAMF